MSCFVLFFSFLNPWQFVWNYHLCGLVQDAVRYHIDKPIMRIWFHTLPQLWRVWRKLKSRQKQQQKKKIMMLNDPTSQVPTGPTGNRGASAVGYKRWREQLDVFAFCIFYSKNYEVYTCSIFWMLSKATLQLALNYMLGHLQWQWYCFLI